MSKITTHVLDAVLGRPGAGIVVQLDVREGQNWKLVAQGITDSDGRCRGLAGDAAKGDFRLTFDTHAYLERSGRKSIYSEIVISFHCDGIGHYHLPLLLSDNSYTTYRGS